MTAWIYDAKEFTSSDLGSNPEVIGFVYVIRSLVTNKCYIGKKNFYSKKTIQRNLKKKKVRVESDWKNYFGSCAELLDEIKENGKDKYDRQIIRLCYTKSEMNYFELKEQIDKKVLLREDYYNSFVGTKIHKKHMKKYLERFPQEGKIEY